MANKKLFNIIFLFILLSVNIIAIFMLSLDGIIVFLSASLGIMASKFAKDGNWIAFVCDIISSLLYLPVCLKEYYFGEFLLSFVIITCNIFCIKEWKKNSTKDVVEINILNKNEVHLISYIFIFSTIIYSLVLYKVNTKFAIINSISTVSFIIGNYYSYRRSIYQFYFLIVYEIAYILLWVSSSITNMFNIVLLIGGVIELLFDVFAIKAWKTMKQSQKTIKIKSLYFFK